tara:strand:+ start:979 stop:1254 length:276 start_codon:yes stop_codon:yes gene_type:complete
MPKYAYKCINCENVFEIVHSIKIKLKKCEKCNTDDSLQRLPSSFIHGKTNSTLKDDKTGNVVKSKIEEFKKDLNKMKKEAKKQEYKPDDNN